MAKKPSPSPAPKKKAAAAPAAPVTRTSAVRNSPVPKKVTPKSAAAPAQGQRLEVTYEMIARRAYEISQSGTGGGELDNWLRAERELRG
jgi:hypothetical protein